MRMKAVRSLREMTRLLNIDPRLRRLCLIEDGEKSYPRSVLSRFTRKVGVDRLKSIIAGSQYSDKKLRKVVAEAVIPYPANQKRNVKGILRVDKKFRAHGSKELKQKCHKKPSIEAVYSFLKNQYSLIMNKVRELMNVTFYAFYSVLCLVLNREAV